jgi:hypothetical protein
MSGAPSLRTPHGVRRLAAWSLIGRDASCLIRVDDTRVSRTHASLEWRDAAWWVRDLGSANGTWVGDERLGADARLLRPGEPLRLGAPDARPWELSESSAPVPFAVRVDSHEEMGPHGELLVLPEDEDGAWMVHRRPSGHWVAERGDEQREVTDGDLLTADDEVWRLCLPGKATSTERMHPDRAPAGERATAAWSVQTARFEFTQSRDWEHARLSLVSGEHRLDLGDRQCWVVLVTLARERLADTQGAEHDQGWVDIDRLAHELGMRRGTVDVYITRARTELADLGVADAARVVVARRGQRRLGIGPERLHIEEG